MFFKQLMYALKNIKQFLLLLSNKKQTGTPFTRQILKYPVPMPLYRSNID